MSGPTPARATSIALDQCPTFRPTLVHSQNARYERPMRGGGPLWCDPIIPSLRGGCVSVTRPYTAGLSVRFSDERGSKTLASALCESECLRGVTRTLPARVFRHWIAGSHSCSRHLSARWRFASCFVGLRDEPGRGNARPASFWPQICTASRINGMGNPLRAPRKGEPCRR